MPDVQTFAVFLAAALLVAITPGPGIFCMLRRERLPAAGPKGSHRASAWVSAALYTFLPARSVSPHS